jgi:hypothetical protein
MRPFPNALTHPLVLGLFVLGLPGPGAQAAPGAEDPVPRGPSEVTNADGRVQVIRTMTLHLAAPADALFPLFGPVREAEWSPDWKPTFIVPDPPAQGRAGAVFTTEDAVWVMTDYDPARRQVRYVTLHPGRVVAQLWIDVSEEGPGRSRAVVTYRMTLLGPEGRATLDHFVTSFEHWPHHWEQAIAATLAGSSSSPRHH